MHQKKKRIGSYRNHNFSQKKIELPKRKEHPKKIPKIRKNDCEIPNKNFENPCTFPIP